jgi:predicted small secreted protein
MKIRIASAVVLAAAVLGTGCSSKTRESIATDLQTGATNLSNAAENVTNDVAEALGRNIATQQGEEQFKNSGHELAGPLTCEATVQDSASKMDIKCTGTTKSGEAAALTGTTDELPGASGVSLSGNFTGTVAGTQVFTTQQLGG